MGCGCRRSGWGLHRGWLVLMEFLPSCLTRGQRGNKSDQLARCLSELLGMGSLSLCP